MLLLALLGLQQLQAVFGTLRKRQPFVHANASRLRWVAGTIIGGEVLGAAMIAFDQFYLKAHFTATGLLFDWSFNIDFFAVVLGFVVLAIAEVFAASTRLDEDQALTICRPWRFASSWITAARSSDDGHRIGGTRRNDSRQPVDLEDQQGPRHPLLYAGRAVSGAEVSAG